MASPQEEAMRRRMRQAMRGEFSSFGGARRGRGAVPRVNPDPRPPNEARADNRGIGQDNRAHQNRNQNGGGGSGQKHPDKDKNKPRGGGGGGGGQGGGAVSNLYTQQTDPRDSQYWRDMINLQTDRNVQLRQLGIEGTYSQGAYEEAIANMQRQLPRDILNTKEEANRGGGFYSSKTGENIGQIEQNYFSQMSGLTRDKQREDSLRQLMQDAISQGYSADEAAAYAEAVDRASQSEMDRPAPPTQPIRIREPKRNNGGGGGDKNKKKKNK